MSHFKVFNSWSHYKKILRVIFKERNHWVMFIKEVQFFESHSEKGSNLWVILEKSSILLSHIQKCSILWVINQTKIQFYWVVNQKKSSILLGRKSEKRFNSLIFSKKKKEQFILWVRHFLKWKFSLSHTKKWVQFLWVMLKRFQFLWVMLKRRVRSCWKEGFNSASHIFQK